jgi:hypothetical protein
MVNDEWVGTSEIAPILGMRGLIAAVVVRVTIKVTGG